MAVRVREVMARSWVGVCVPLSISLHHFQVIFVNTIELSSIYFSSIKEFDISKQIQQHSRIGKIFAHWHLAIAIASHI